MPRQAKPYVERGWFVSRPGGRYLKQCLAEQGVGEARRVLTLKLAELETEQGRMGGRLAGAVTVTDLFVAFLEEVQATKDPDTFRYYQRRCTEFAKLHGTKPARQITRAVATTFRRHMLQATYRVGQQPPRRYSPKTVNHAC
jgi:hypothetical protein